MKRILFAGLLIWYFAHTGQMAEIGYFGKFTGGWTSANVVGPFDTLKQCLKIKEQIDKYTSRTLLTSCWEYKGTNPTQQRSR